MVLIAREASDRDNLALLTGAINANGCFVGVDDHIVVGFAILEYSFYANGFIPLFVVSREHRRSGTGTALLKHAATHCRTPKLFSSTNESNREMQALLKKVGFRESGRIDNLDDGDPEIVYFKRVSEGPPARS